MPSAFAVTAMPRLRRIYADAYNRDPEFYAFTRSLSAYRETFSNKGDVLLLDPDSDFFKYLKEAEIGQQ